MPRQFTRVPAADIEDVVVKSLDEHFRNQSGISVSAITGDSAIAELIDRIEVHKDRLAIRQQFQDLGLDPGQPLVSWSS